MNRLGGMGPMRLLEERSSRRRSFKRPREGDIDPDSEQLERLRATTNELLQEIPVHAQKFGFLSDHPSNTCCGSLVKEFLTPIRTRRVVPPDTQLHGFKVKRIPMTAKSVGTETAMLKQALERAAYLRGLFDPKLSYSCEQLSQRVSKMMRNTC